MVHYPLFTHRFKRARHVRAMRQADVAKALTVTQGRVSKLETGRGQPTVPQIYQLANLFGVTADWLLGLSDEGGPPPPEREPIEADTETSAA